MEVVGLWKAGELSAPLQTSGVSSLGSSHLCRIWEATLQELTALQGRGGHAAEAYARPAPAHVVLREDLSGLGMVGEQK